MRPPCAAISFSTSCGGLSFVEAGRSSAPRCAPGCGRGRAASARRPSRKGTPPRENCATEAGYFCIFGSTSFRDRARPSVTTKPSRASAIAGSTSRLQGSRPCSFQARCRPATVPGTPTERWLSWCRSSSYLPSLQEHRGVAPRRRRLAEVVRRRLARRGTIEQEAAAADVARRGMRDGQRERGRHRGVHGVAAVAQDVGADLRGPRRPATPPCRCAPAPAGFPPSPARRPGTGPRPGSRAASCPPPAPRRGYHPACGDPIRAI